MKTTVEDYNTIAKHLKKDYPKLSDFEILSLAIQLERNQILENGLVINSEKPSGLEAIAIALGFTDGQFQNTITDVLREMAYKE
ncbi:histidine kinase [Bizionia sp.]|uniref:histidine kinase n=1 Tax=Bizionia sp. TaxID=1954480 RepID=UPI003A90DB38